MKEEKKYYGHYVGIVVQNNDPLHKGRVKIFVPHISPSVYQNWNKVPQDKKFKFIGRNIQSDLSDILQELKEILPWCICASPLTGENTSGRYNAQREYASTSDSKYIGLSGFQQFKSTNPNVSTVDGTGENAGAIYEKYKTKLQDPFTDPATNNTAQCNPYGNEYIPTTYPNKAKGSFGIPAVGSHLWVFFYEGDPLYPVYFASAFGENDWTTIYNIEDNTGLDYPGSFENKVVSENTPDTDQYRNKYVLNQKGGAFEIINSDGRESIKLSHYGGSFKSFNNHTNVELATRNDQKLVLYDQFYTVKGTQNIYVGSHKDENIKGDHYVKIGNLRSDSVEQWKTLVSTIATVKQLFDIRRAEKIESTYLKYTSQLQQRDGEFAVCPVCNGAKGVDYVVINNKSSKQINTPSITSTSNEVSKYAKVSQPLINAKATQRLLPNVSRCPVCNGTGKSPSSMNGDWVTETLKEYDSLKKLYESKIVELAKIEQTLGVGGSQIVDITKHKVETIGLVMNDFGSIRVDSVGKIAPNQVLIDNFGVFVSQKETPIIEYVHVDDLPGGNYTLNCCNRYSLNCGAGGMSLKSYGPVNISGTITNVGGTQLNLSAEIETNINAENRILIESNNVIIRNKSGNQVLIDSNLGVAGNMVVQGGAHIDGELSVNHITAPLEVQETELVKLFGKLLSGLQFQCFIAGVEPGAGVTTTVTLVADSNDNKVQAYDHSHHFNNIPLKLTASNDATRIAAKANNETTINPALPIANQHKTS